MLRTVACAIGSLVLAAAAGGTSEESPGMDRHPLDLVRDGVGWFGVNAEIEAARAPARGLLVTCSPARNATVGTMLVGGLAKAGQALIEVRLLEPTKRPVRWAVYLKDRDGLWYEHPFPQELAVGRTKQATVELAKPGAFEPRGHFGAWDGSALLDTREIGLRLFAEEETPFRVLVSALSVSASEPENDPLRIFDLTIPRGSVGPYETFEASFRVNRAFQNPFDPQEVDVVGEIRAPKVAAVRVPGFFSQAYAPSSPQGGGLVPFGFPRWVVRFTPTIPGEHQLTVHIRTGSAAAATPTIPFRVMASKNRGFLRVSDRDPRYFQHATGEPFHPVGHNLHSPVDQRGSWLVGVQRPVDRGAASYDARLERMARSGQNLTELWMASWSLDLEWSGQWPRYRGAGRYNLHNAACLDRVFGLASRHGVCINLVVDNHGKASEAVDAEWQDHPYNRRNGGFLSRPQELFTNSRAFGLYQQKLRYILARWGQAPNLLGLIFWNEINLAGDSDPVSRRQKAEWYAKMAAYAKSIAPHVLVGVHFSSDFQSVDRLLASLPEVDYIACDAYHESGDLIGLLEETAVVLAQYGKPVLVTEFGGNWYGGSVPQLKADLHAGLWSSAFTPLSGTPLFWWFDFIEKHELDDEFAAVRRFLAADDPGREGWNWQQVKIRSEDPRILDIGSLSLAGARSARVYLFDKQASSLWVDAARLKPVPPIDLEITGMQPGTYRAEFWETGQGKKIHESSVGSVGGALAIRTPAFVRDLAVKVFSTPPVSSARKGGPGK